MLLLDHVVARAERDQMGVVGGGGYRDASRAPHVRVAQLVGEHLQLIGAEVVVVPQHVVVRRPAGALGHARRG